MIKHLHRFMAPLTALLLVMIGMSFLGTLLILKLEAAGGNFIQVGLLTVFYYLGYALGAFRLEPYIQRVGHIRAYATFAAIMAIVALFHGLYLNLYVWLLSRLIVGVVSAGMCVVVESWLMGLSEVNIRGRILSLYMVGLYIAMSLGQFLFRVTSIEDIFPYILIAVCACASIIPLCATRSSTPVQSEVEVSSLKKMWELSKTGFVGCAASGLMMGVVYGIIPVVLKMASFTPERIGITVGCITLGGALFQYPIGKCSDIFPRRRVLFASSMLAFFAVCGLFFTMHSSYWLFSLSAFLFGGFVFVLYPLAINLACDLVDHKDLTSAVSGLLMYYSIGATVGPFVASAVVQYLGGNGVYYYFGSILIFLMSTVLYRSTIRTSLPVSDQEGYVATPMTTPIVAEFNPRGEDDVKK